MNQNDNQNTILSIEQKIRDHQLSEALQELQQLETRYPDNERILFDLGTVQLLLGDFSVARECFRRTLALGNNSYMAYYNAGVAEERTGDLKEAEKLYLRAIEVAEGTERITIQEAVFSFYLRIDAIDSARMLGESVAKNAPEQYSGHHMLNKLDLQSGNYSKITQRLNDIGDLYWEDPVFWVDSIVVREKTEGYEAVLNWLEQNPKAEELIPELVLREKVKCLIRSKREDDVLPILLELYENFQEDDSGLVSVMLLLLEAKYLEAGSLANDIMVNKNGQIDFAFAVALVLGIVALYYAYDRKLPEEELEFAVTCLKQARAWLEEFQIDTLGIQEAITFFQTLTPAKPTV